ncbi:hypothetical protein L1887_51981 [Cichorium endivia]|nr:hypothetical protein L1887_51981 [Cichorium endivia]
MDGILEAIGMRGPLFGIVQNLFLMIFLCAFVMLAFVILPYIVGRALGSGPGLVRLLAAPVKLLRYVTDPLFDSLIAIGANSIWPKLAGAVGMAPSQSNVTVVVLDAAAKPASQSAASWISRFAPSALGFAATPQNVSVTAAAKESAAAAMLVRLLPHSVTSSTQWAAVSACFDVALAAGVRGTLDKLSELVSAFFVGLDAHRAGHVGHRPCLLRRFRSRLLDAGALCPPALLQARPAPCGGRTVGAQDVHGPARAHHQGDRIHLYRARRVPARISADVRIHTLDGRHDLHVHLCPVRVCDAARVAARRAVLDPRPERPELPSDPRDPRQAQPHAAAQDRRIRAHVRRHLGRQRRRQHLFPPVRRGVDGAVAAEVDAVRGVDRGAYRPAPGAFCAAVGNAQDRPGRRVAAFNDGMVEEGGKHAAAQQLPHGRRVQIRAAHDERECRGGLLRIVGCAPDWLYREMPNGRQMEGLCRVPADDKAITTGPLIIPLDADGNAPNERLAEAIAKQDADAEKHTPRPTYAHIYLPSHYRARITAVLVLLWLSHCAAFMLGLGVPLVLGRALFALRRREVHDVYAYVLGLSLLWTAWSLVGGASKMWTRRKRRARMHRTSPGMYLAVHMLVKAKRVLKAAALLVGVAGVMPLVMGMVIDQYLVAPLRDRGQAAVRLGQVWACGVIEARLALFAMRLLGVPEHGMVAWFMAKVDHVLRGGLYPRARVRVAWTYIVAPITLAGVLLLATPTWGARALIEAGWMHAPTVADEYALQRRLFGVIQTAALLAVLVSLVRRRMEDWTDVLKDEVFLESTVLKNYTDTPPSADSATAGDQQGGQDDYAAEEERLEAFARRSRIGLGLGVGFGGSEELAGISTACDGV